MTDALFRIRASIRAYHIRRAVSDHARRKRLRVARQDLTTAKLRDELGRAA